MHTKSFSMLVINKQTLKFCCLFSVICCLNGCGAKENIVYKDIFVPVKCDQTIPLKPKNDGTFETHKEIMKYYIKCESIAKICTGDINASSN